MDGAKRFGMTVLAKLAKINEIYISFRPWRNTTSKITIHKINNNKKRGKMNQPIRIHRATH